MSGPKRMEVVIPARLAREVDAHRPAGATLNWYAQWLIADQLAVMGYAVTPRKPSTPCAVKSEKPLGPDQKSVTVHLVGLAMHETLHATKLDMPLSAYVRELLTDALSRHSRRHHGET